MEKVVQLSVVYPLCAFHELQKQDEIEDSEYTNFPVHVLTKNQKQEHQQQQQFIFPNTTQRMYTHPTPNMSIAYS